jgi:hypothetical protein
MNQQNPQKFIEIMAQPAYPQLLSKLHHLSPLFFGTGATIHPVRCGFSFAHSNKARVVLAEAEIIDLSAICNCEEWEAAEAVILHELGHILAGGDEEAAWDKARELHHHFGKAPQDVLEAIRLETLESYGIKDFPSPSFTEDGSYVDSFGDSWDIELIAS